MNKTSVPSEEEKHNPLEKETSIIHLDLNHSNNTLRLNQELEITSPEANTTIWTIIVNLGQQDQSYQIIHHFRVTFQRKHI